MTEDYSYENSLEWVPRDYPIIDSTTPPQEAPQHWQQGQKLISQPRQALMERAGGTRMSKAEALSLLESLKTAIVAGVLIVFVMLSALVASHVASSAANTAPGPLFNPSQQQGPYNGGDFFRHHHHDDGGYWFGGGGSQPVGGQPSSGTNVS